jgi:hypothetical protein
MENAKYNDEIIIQYLLGSLPNEETERLDKLSLIDDEYAKRLTIVENDLIDSYLRGELSGENLQKFKLHYLASPKRREKVRAAKSFQTFVEKGTGSGQRESKPKKTQILSISNNSTHKSSIPPDIFTFSRLIFAAAALLLAGIGWLVFEISRLRNQVAQAQIERNAQIERKALEQRDKELQELIERQRLANTATEKELKRIRSEKDRLERQMELERQIAKSQPSALPTNLNIASFKLTAPSQAAGLVTTISVPIRTDYVALQIELEPDYYPAYNAILLSQPGRIPTGWKRERLRPRDMGKSKVIEVLIPATLFRSREYLLSLTGITGRGIPDCVRGYPFKVLKSGY